MKDTFFSSNLRFNTKGILREFSKPIVMGILNTTPDSFYADSRVNSVAPAMNKVSQLIEEGATVIDVGGYSSRPGAASVETAEEIERTAPVIEAIRNQFPDVLISIDTFRAAVAEKAILCGADMVNDISGGTIDPEIMHVAAGYNCPYILMHMRGTPQTMMKNTQYDNLINDLLHFFSTQIEKGHKAGIKDIIIDPGFGFSKTLEQNYKLLQSLSLLNVLDKPILAGVSRKSMIYRLLDTTPSESLNGTTVLNTYALLNGAQILRVHDVKAAFETIQLTQKIRVA